MRQTPRDHVARRVQIRAAMMRHHTLRIARRAGGVVESNGVPFVVRQLPRVVGLRVGEKRFVVQPAHPLARRCRIVFHLNHEWCFFAEQCKRVFDDARKLTIREQHFRFAMLQHESDGVRIEPRVQRVEHRPGHRHAEMRLEHRGNVGQHHRHRVAPANAVRRERRSQTTAAAVCLMPGLPTLAIDHGQRFGIHMRGPLNVGKRREGNKIRSVLFEADVVVTGWVLHGFSLWRNFFLARSRCSRHQKCEPFANAPRQSPISFFVKPILQKG